MAIRRGSQTIWYWSTSGSCANGARSRWGRITTSQSRTPGSRSFELLDCQHARNAGRCEDRLRVVGGQRVDELGQRRAHG